MFSFFHVERVARKERKTDNVREIFLFKNDEKLEK